MIRSVICSLSRADSIWRTEHTIFSYFNQTNESLAASRECYYCPDSHGLFFLKLTFAARDHTLYYVCEIVTYEHNQNMATMMWYLSRSNYGDCQITHFVAHLMTMFVTSGHHSYM